MTISEAVLDSGSESRATSSPYETSGNYFDVLEIKPYLGRFFTQTMNVVQNSAPYVVLTYSYWHSHFRTIAISWGAWSW